MDAAGNNRYELLFMDDDGESSPPAVVEKKPPGTAPASTTPKKPSAAKKPSNQAEKENKSGTLNKDQAGHKKGQLEQSKPNASAIRNKSRATEQTGNRNVTFKPDAERREPRNNRRNFKDTEFGTAGGNENPNDRQQKQFRDRENRPPRNRDANFRSGKREFDRQSGSDKTGVKSVDKRDGAGAHNWGSVKQEIEDINNPTAEADGTLTDKEDFASEQPGEGTTLPEEEEVKEMTLDEWKAMSQQREKPKYNIRKPGEGEDTTQWKKMVALNKKKENDSEEELEYDPSLYPQRVGRLQRIVDIEFNFNDGRRSGGNFGGRGRGPRRFGGGEKPRFGGGDKPRFGGGDKPHFGGGDKPRFEGGDKPRFEGGDKPRFEGGDKPRFEGGDKPRFEGNRGNAPNDMTAAGSNKPSKPRNFGDKPKSATLKIDYESQFPTLS